MKKFIPVFLVFLLTFLAGCEPEVARVESTPTPESRGVAAKPIQPASDPGHIICVQCKGERFMMVRTNTGGQNADMRQSCPILHGQRVSRHKNRSREKNLPGL